MVIDKLPVILSFDFILCTGTTGSWVKKFLLSGIKHANLNITPEEVEKKVILCESGPKGGDVQIAHAALSGIHTQVMMGMYH